MSFFLDPYLPILAYLAVWGVLVLLGYLLKAEKHGIILKPYYFMLKTVVFNSWLERIGNRFRRIWLVYFDIGAAMGLGLLVFAITIFLQNAVGLLTRAPSAGPTLLIVPLPGLTIGWDVFPYVLISIAILLIPHEAAHGIASVLDKVPIKSSGVFMAVFLPGGFVEIDEEDLAKRASKTKLRVFAAGSSTNVISWLLVVLLLSNFALTISPLYNASPSGVLVTRLSDGGPAQTAGIQPWSVITSLDNTTVNRVGDLANYLARVRPGSFRWLFPFNCSAPSNGWPSSCSGWA
ncbi:PDZ domain-containing protein [Candidatus Bathyarchaeota archaeon]|nr:MAG: PDZ domain-containing protein [Candidatus Bathyarchaeota archaeon]